MQLLKAGLQEFTEQSLFVSYIKSFEQNFETEFALILSRWQGFGCFHPSRARTAWPPISPFRIWRRPGSARQGWLDSGLVRTVEAKWVVENMNNNPLQGLPEPLQPGTGLPWFVDMTKMAGKVSAKE